MPPVLLTRDNDFSKSPSPVLRFLGETGPNSSLSPSPPPWLITLVSIGSVTIPSSLSSGTGASIKYLLVSYNKKGSWIPK